MTLTEFFTKPKLETYLIKGMIAPFPPKNKCSFRDIFGYLDSRPQTLSTLSSLCMLTTAAFLVFLLDASSTYQRNPLFTKYPPPRS